LQKQLRVSGMDCASCAAAVQSSLRKLEGVSDVEVDVVGGRVRVDFSNEKLADEDFTAAIRRAGYDVVNPDSGSAPEIRSFWNRRGRSVMVLLAGVAFVLGWIWPRTETGSTLATSLLAVATIAAGWYVVPRGLKALRSGVLDMNFLMSIAAIGAWVIGEPTEAAATMFLFAVAELLESRSMDRARNAIKALMDLSPTEAIVLKDGREIVVAADRVDIGSTIVVRPGAKIPLDGDVLSGTSSVNQAPITGESIPVDKEPGDTVFAGTLNSQGALTVRVTRLASDTTLARIIHAVEEAQGSRAPSQSFVERFARVYTPAVVLLAIALAVFPPMLGLGDARVWLYRALTMLVIACPCALVISTPITIVSALTGAARSGILIKGGAYLEALGRITTIAFDKTGTLTFGKPEVTSVRPLAGRSERDVIGAAAAVEQHSEHPLARAIVEYASGREAIAPSVDFQAVIGLGARATVAGTVVHVGNERLAVELGIETGELKALREQLEAAGQTAVFVANASGPIGMISLADAVRPEAKTTLATLRSSGIQRIVMLTGDSQRTAAAVAAELGIDDVRSQLLPEDKVQAVRDLSQHGPVAFVGDGINDAPALAVSSVGIAMGVAGTDVALEAADIALMGDDLPRLKEAIDRSRRALQIIKQNIAFSIATKVIFLGLALAGAATLWMAIAADMGASLLVVANGMRALRSSGWAWGRRNATRGQGG
jgi:Cd2+/Zn2+-exporting ATPase